MLSAARTDIRPVHAERHAHRSGKRVERTLRRNVRRHSHATSRTKHRQRLGRGDPAGLTRRRDHAIVAERRPRLRVHRDGGEHRPQADDRLLIAVS